VWEQEPPYKFEGKYWTLDIPPYDDVLQGPFFKPYQKPSIPLAMAGLSPNSGTLRQAGLQGCIPMSFNVGREYLAGHWYNYVEGAESGGNTADRNKWRVAHNILVADTDEEAMDMALNGAMGQTYREWMLPAYEKANMIQIMLPELNVTKAKDVPLEYMAEHKWLVGSPDTVVKKLELDLEVSGGFGSIIGFTFDYLDQPERFRRHLELIGTEVLPRIKGIVHETEPLSALTPPESALTGAKA